LVAIVLVALVFSSLPSAFASPATLSQVAPAYSPALGSCSLYERTYYLAVRLQHPGTGAEDVHLGVFVKFHIIGLGALSPTMITLEYLAPGNIWTTITLSAVGGALEGQFTVGTVGPNFDGTTQVRVTFHSNAPPGPYLAILQAFELVDSHPLPISDPLGIWTGLRESCAPVGGLVAPVNKFAILAPYLALVGLVGVVTATAAVLRKKRRD